MQDQQQIDGNLNSSAFKTPAHNQYIYEDEDTVQLDNSVPKQIMRDPPLSAPHITIEPPEEDMSEIEPYKQTNLTSIKANKLPNLEGDRLSPEQLQKQSHMKDFAPPPNLAFGYFQKRDQNQVDDMKQDLEDFKMSLPDTSEVMAVIENQKRIHRRVMALKGKQQEVQKEISEMDQTLKTHSE